MSRSLKSTQMLKCMNHEPATSKYGSFAPRGGCNETIETDSNTVKALCSGCTQRVVNMKYTEKWTDED